MGIIPIIPMPKWGNLGKKRLGYLAKAYTLKAEPKSSPSSLAARPMLLTTILYQIFLFLLE